MVKSKGAKEIQIKPLCQVKKTVEMLCTSQKSIGMNE
jgi:hypothetical protein